MQIGAKLIHRLALRCAARDGRNFGPEPAFFGFVHNGVNLHTKVVEAAGVAVPNGFANTQLIDLAFAPLIRLGAFCGFQPPNSPSSAPSYRYPLSGSQ